MITTAVQVLERLMIEQALSKDGGTNKKRLRP
jgi:hypothetical protein